MLSQVRTGKIKGLAVTSIERSKSIPELPTIGETLPGYIATSWYGVGAPARTPEPIIARLEAAIGEVLKKQEIIDRFTGDLGMDMPPVGRNGLQEFIDKDRALWGPTVKASGVKFE
jgi:tripartite-type tricarboxylate transporter receptor subunit TctC